MREKLYYCWCFPKTYCSFQTAQLDSAYYCWPFVSCFVGNLDLKTVHRLVYIEWFHYQCFDSKSIRESFALESETLSSFIVHPFRLLGYLVLVIHNLPDHCYHLARPLDNEYVLAKDDDQHR